MVLSVISLFFLFIKAMATISKILGIDLGTTNSCISILENGKPILIHNSEGARLTPSIVGFRESDRLVGQLAKRQAIPNAKNTISSIKRFMGRRWSDTESERLRVPYTCVPGKDNTVNVRVRDRDFTPQEISAMILRKLKEDAEAYLGEPVTQAVITVPAYFSDAQRQATIDAGIIAGLQVKRIINEPTAAALAYGLAKSEQEHCILVFDLGGGTFDVSILRLGDGVVEVVATAGNNRLGGDDFDACIVQFLVRDFQRVEGIDLSQDAIALQRLSEAAEKAKIELSSATTTFIHLPFITADEQGPRHIEVELTRARFDELTRHLVIGTIEPMAQAIKDAKCTVDQIDRILLVGGSTRIPAIQSALRKYFKGKTLDCSLNPDEVVALGAAVQGGIINGELSEIGREIILIDVTPLSLGVKTVGGVFSKIIERNTSIPTSQTRLFSTAADGQTSVEVHVLQGEWAMADNNICLGKLLLTDIPPAPRGVPQIEVTFEIDVDGILTVSARNVETGRAQRMSFEAKGHLSEKEINAILSRWQAELETDQKQKQLAELKNSVEITLLSSYELMLRHHGNRIPPEVRANADRLAKQLRLAIANPNTKLEELQKAHSVFQQLLFRIGSLFYKNDVDFAMPSGERSTPRKPAGDHRNHYRSPQSFKQALYETVE